MPEDACRSVASRVVPGLTATRCFLFLRAFQSLLPAIFWLITNLCDQYYRMKNLALSKSRVTYLLPVCKTKNCKELTRLLPREVQSEPEEPTSKENRGKAHTETGESRSNPNATSYPKSDSPTEM